MSDELTKLMSMGFGEFVDKEKMAADKLFPTKNCFSAFIKRDITKLEEENLDQEFFKLAQDKDCNRPNYIANFEKDMDKISKHVAAKYNNNGDVSYSTPSTPASISKLNILYISPLYDFKFSRTLMLEICSNKIPLKYSTHPNVLIIFNCERPCMKTV